MLGRLLGASLLRDPWAERFAIGIAMIPWGEVGLIFAKLGRTSEILNNELYAALIMVIALTTLSSPVLLKGFYRRFLSGANLNIACEPTVTRRLTHPQGHG